MFPAHEGVRYRAELRAVQPAPGAPLRVRQRRLRLREARLALTRRRLRFLLFEQLLPVGMSAFRWLIRTWRVDGPDPALIERLGAAPRVIFTWWHGTLPNAMVLHHLFRPYGRRWVGLTTPSLDGRLLAAALSYLDVDSAPLADGVRGVAGATDFVQQVREGSIGAVAADGPRGPRHVVKDGLARTVEAADALLIVGAVAATRRIRFRSWDRAQVAAPFARVYVCCRLLTAAECASRASIQAALDTVHAEAEGKAVGRER